jgi:hypothetical protein
MTNLLPQIQDYVQDTLGLKTSTGSILDLQVPFFIKDIYELISIELTLTEKHAFEVLLVIQREATYPGIVLLRKHLNQIRKITHVPLVYVNSILSAGDRKSLISQHVNFIQPHTQLFIPELAIDIRETFRQQRKNIETDNLLPATQAVLIACFNRGWSLTEAYTSSQLAQGLDYSRVTLSKVIEQMIAKNFLVRGEKTRTYRFDEPVKTVFKNALPFLKSPVKRVTFANARPLADEGIFLAGETALAHYSMLAQPAIPTYALTQEHFSRLLKEGCISQTDAVDEIKARIELWSYPNPTGEGDIADPVSVFLSLKDNHDERIQMALDEMMGEIRWLK